MSDAFVALIPVDPKADVPQNAQAVRDAVAQHLGTEEVRIKNYGKLQFIDCGQNFSSVTCPTCSAKITTEQWHAWMNEDWHSEDGFHLHRHQTPCCTSGVTLNDLIYDMPQGFARWMISARADDLADIAPFSALADLPLRLIRQRY